MKTAELTGAALDWAVAECEGKVVEFGDPSDPWLTIDGIAHMPLHAYTPSTDWAQGGAIIERERIDMWVHAGKQWAASKDKGIAEYRGTTPLIAAMRCYVASKLGDEVEVPEGLQ